MLPKYDDILALARQAGATPQWWDENGVPRFAPFRPSMLGVYDCLAALAEIECAGPSCGQRLFVAAGRPLYGLVAGNVVTYGAQDVVAVLEAWGDPPRHNMPSGERCAGETMACDFVRLVEVWDRADGRGWRKAKFPTPLAEDSGNHHA